MAGLFFGDKYENEMKELQKKTVQDPKNLHLQVRIGDLLEKYFTFFGINMIQFLLSVPRGRSQSFISTR